MVEKWEEADPHPDPGQSRKVHGASNVSMFAELRGGRPPGQLHCAHTRDGGRGGGRGVPGKHPGPGGGPGTHLAPACPV